MRQLLTIVPVTAGLLLAAPVAANDWSEQVQGQIDVHAETFFESGFHYGGYSHEGSLDDGENEELMVRLGPGMDSFFIGVCDNDCSDLDLTIYDSSGKEVDSDLEVDDFPIISVRPPRDGAYRIRVSMAGCSTEPCYYAIQQFVK